MSQVSPRMRSTARGFSWWCPACDEMHLLPSSWAFDGNFDAPTFNPSFKHTGKQAINVGGKWTGEWVRGTDGKALDWCCHYIITKGQVAYCGDCTHVMAGQTVTMPDLPLHVGDDE